MVRVTIHVRPKQGYHHPSKIDYLEINSVDRLETIQEKYNTTGSTTRLYYGGHELPLNSSVGSHNLDDNAILECCRSPAMSAALSACLKDMDKIKKLPLNERRRGNLMHILQSPTTISHDANHDIWQAKSWTDDKLKSRIINFATMKAVLQRQDRYHIHDLPQCNDCHELHSALEMHNVWKGGGGGGSGSSDQSKRNFLNQQAHIFKPLKNDGNPSTNWLLLEEKLNVQQKIRSDLSLRGLQVSAGYDSPPADYLEEFVRRDHARHNSTVQNDSRVPSDRIDDTGDSHLAYLAPSPPRRRNAPPRLRQNNGNSLDETSTPGTTSTTAPTRSRRKPYIPQYASGPFAVLATLHLSMHSKHKRSNGRRLLTLTEEQLKRMAQPLCRSNLYDKGRIRGRNAFVCMDGLVEKQLVRKEIVRNTAINGGDEIEKWGLLRDGEMMGEFCSEFDRAVNDVLPIQQMNEKITSDTSMNLALCLDAREDVHLLKRMKWSCNDEGVPYSEKELPAGDYLFLDQSTDGQESVLPLIIERKSWSDLADSCHGKGRARNRLECVKIGSNASECSGNCQLCKMKRSGCKQLMFIVEGERCLGRDGVHRTAKKCTKENCCSVCKLLSERHNVTQDILEGVLHRLQMEHGCFIHYTKSYNETIQSLFDMRSILQGNSTNFFGEPIPFVSYASNARRSSRTTDRTPPIPRIVQEMNVEVILASIPSGEWKSDMVRDLLGLETSSQSLGTRSSQQNQCTKPPDKTIPLDNEDELICIELESPRGRSYTNVEVGSCHSARGSTSRPNKHQKDTICLDLDSEDERMEYDAAKNIRGGGNPYSLSSDEDIEILTHGKNEVSKASKTKDSCGNNGNDCDEDDSDGDIFSNLSRFEGDRRRKLLERSYDDNSDSDISIVFGRSKSAKKRKLASRKKKACRQTPQTKLSASHAANNAREDIAVRRSITTSSVAKKLPYDHDVCLLSSSSEEELQHIQPGPLHIPAASAPVYKTGEEHDVFSTGSIERTDVANSLEPELVRQPQISRKRKASELVAEGDKVLDNKHACTILVLHGWDEYYQRFFKRLDGIWKEIYSGTSGNQMSDLYTKSVARLNDLTKESEFLFVQRKTLMRFTLWMQLAVGVHVRPVQRIQFADEIKRFTGQGMNKSSVMRSPTKLPAISSRPLQRNTQYDVPHSTPSTSNAHESGSQRQKAGMSVDRTRPLSINRQYDVPHSTPSTSNAHESVSQRQKTGMSMDRKRPPSINKESDPVREARLRRFDKATTKRVSSVDHSTKQPSKWSCPRCTSENSSFDEHCSACGGNSPTKSLPAAARLDNWPCPSCTFENRANADSCSVCGADKATTKRVSSVDHSTKQPSKWSCPLCTSENSPFDENCSACGGNSPTKPFPAAARLDNWRCSSCTFENKANVGNCSVCGAAKLHSPTMSPVASLSTAVDTEYPTKVSRTSTPSKGNSPTKPFPAAVRLDTWRCSSCTFENRANADNCSVCGAVKLDSLAMTPVTSLPTAFDAEHPPKVLSVSTPSKATPNKRVVRCGACGKEGHNRSNATEHNCEAYDDEKEIDRREKLRKKRENAIAGERKKIEAIEQESANSERMQEELARQIEELERNKERAEEFRKEELKRRKAKVKRLEKSQNKN